MISLFILTVLLTAVVVCNPVDQTTQNTTISTSHAACQLGLERLPFQVAIPGSSNYSIEKQNYWSLTSVQETPFCIFTPNTAEAVITSLQILQNSSTPFALRGGGHNPASNGSALSDGVLIAADRLNLIELDTSSETPFVKVGAGIRWNQVYDYLAGHGFTATGGRYYDIGVAGYTVGGGITYFRSVHGWSADTVINFEVALPSGLINANATSNADLFWALKGGSGNFGYVTRYDFKIFPLTPIYGGNFVTDKSGVTPLLEATASYVNSVTGGMKDVLGAVNPTIQLDLGTREFSTFTNVFYNKSVNQAPDSIKNFTDIKSSSSTVHGPRDFIGFYNETATFESNERRLFRATSLKTSSAAVLLAYSVFTELASALKTIQGCQVYVLFQPMTQEFINATHAAGDAIALDPSQGPFIAVLYAASWNTTSDDAYLSSYLQQAIDQLNMEAKSQHIDYPFIFLNDAGAGQDPLSLYGQGKSLSRLQSIARKYDPNSLFQTFGHNTFKL